MRLLKIIILCMAVLTVVRSNGQGLPDLKIDTIRNVSPLIVCQGCELSIDFTIVNLDSTVAVSTVTGVFLIPDSSNCMDAASLDSFFLIHTAVTTENEMSDNTEDESEYPLIDCDFPTGDYRLVLFADFGNALVESNDSNNIYCYPALIRVVDKPNLTAVNFSGNTSACIGNPTQITASVGNCDNCTYTWSNGRTGSVQGLEPGTHSVTAINSCDSIIDSVVITAISAQPAPVIAGDSIFCEGESATLNIDNICGGCAYLWSNGSPQTSVTVITAGLYAVTVTGTCGFESASQQVTTKPNPSVTISLANPTINPGTDVTLTVSGGVSYVWNTGETTASITVHPIAQVIYSVTATAANGCTSTATADVMTGILLPETLASLNIFTETEYRSIGIDLESVTEEEIQISVFNMLGQEVYRSGKETVFGKFSHVLQLNETSAGTFLVKLSLRETDLFRKVILR